MAINVIKGIRKIQKESPAFVVLARRYQLRGGMDKVHRLPVVAELGMIKQYA